MTAKDWKRRVLVAVAAKVAGDPAPLDELAAELAALSAPPPPPAFGPDEDDDTDLHTVEADRG